MLYISRVVRREGAGKLDYDCTSPKLTRRPEQDMLFGVVDTDDGSEEIVTLAYLGNACCYLGVPVSGVLVERGELIQVKPWQSPDTYNSVQKKLAGLYGVEVNEYCGAISSIYFDGTDMKTVATVRLSDISRWCGDFLFLNVDYCGVHAVTLVIDDKLSFTPWSFFGYESYSPGVNSLGVKFDLRELSWDDKAWLIYDLLFKWEGSSDPFASIIDHSERKARMRAKLRRQGRCW